MPKFRLKFDTKIKSTNTLVQRLFEPSIHGISQSLLENYRDCQVKMRYLIKGYYLPSQSESIMFGSAFHYALDIIYNAIKRKDVINDDSLKRFLAMQGSDLLQKLRDEYNESTTETKFVLEEQINKVIIMLPLYFRYWKIDYSFKWVGLEREFKFPIAGMFFRGKRDGEFLKDGKNENEKSLWLFETKTKSRYNIDTIMKWITMQLQINAYLYSLSIDYKQKPVGVIYNIIRNPAIKKTARKSWNEYKAELELDIQARPSFYFQRIERIIPFNRVQIYYKKLENELKNFQTWYNSPEILDVPCGSHCEGKYGQCLFINTCASNGKDFSMLEKRTNLFPEL